MPSAPHLSALFQSRRNPAARVGAERVALLREIGRLGSISAAAKATGFSYKGAWDAVQALNNLFEQPLVVSRAGGAQGGTAVVTPAGEALLAAFARIETALSQVSDQLDAAMAEAGAPASALLWSFGMKTSARNMFRGLIETVTPGTVNAEVRLRVAPELAVTAIVTSDSVADLGLVAGREALALISASSVILATGEGALRTSARNALEGVVVAHETGAVNDEVTLELAPGKQLVAVITRSAAEELGLAVGEAATALIKASHVILAVD